MTSSVTNILLVDDSAIVRGLLSDLIGKKQGFHIIATSSNGQQGVDDYKRLKPDIVLMDIEMPEKDGLTALKEILNFDPQAKVIMCSSLTQSGAQATMEALRIGAVDCLAKPSSRTVERSQAFTDRLFSILGQFSVHTATSEPNSIHQAPAKLTYTSLQADLPLTFLPYPVVLPNNFPLALAIGSSTGGPKALIELLSKVNKKISLPIFIAQHIPEGFSGFLAENIQKNTGFPTHEAQQDMVIEAGHIYIAPGGRHMGIKPGVPKRINLPDLPPVNFCKPSVDVMLDSLSAHYGPGLLSVILTGMGADGKNAVERLVEAGKHNIILAQDKQTSVVWGMPGAVAQAGLCHAVLPLDELPDAINKLIHRRIPG